VTDKSRYAEVILPLPVQGTFTYRLPDNIADAPMPGCRVVVQFGSRKIYTGLVRRIVDTVSPGIDYKEILSVLDERPLVSDLQFRFWEWLSQYYMCSIGEVMNAALPSAFKLASESRVAINPSWEVDSTPLNDREFSLVESLLASGKSLEISGISRVTGVRKVIPIVKTLIEKGVVVMEEEVREKIRPRKVAYITLSAKYAANDDALRELFDGLEKKARKQLEILMTFIHLSHTIPGAESGVNRMELLKRSGCNPAVLDSMIKKGIFSSFLITERKEIDGAPQEPAELPELTLPQENASREIRDAWKSKDIVLLHGVTSSGKTEVYVRLMKEAIAEGKQVLYLLPEIALTTQIISRLRKYFGNRIGVYHSRFNENDRAELWKNSATDPTGNRAYDIILGARSAVFLPFSALGLVIVDEEHDPSFKQNDPAPRYNGRDAALMLAQLSSARSLLGSATPAVESYYHAREGRWGLVELSERYGDMKLPSVRLVNLMTEFRKGRMKSHFSETLLELLRKALENKEQAILFQNRRGFSLRLECETCNWMPTCRNCDVTLVYHKAGNQLRCHYCGATTGIPSFCPECKNPGLRMKGFGTEKVEEELGIFLPGARIARMDLDTTRSRHAYQNIINGFEEQKIDILVGTQMVTKGLDFDHVSTVCILNADNMLSFPDFRSEERSFQLMAQVSGRSGRRNKQGIVLIQTYNPGHHVIRSVVAHDYFGMFENQLRQRRQFGYPPFFRLVLLKVKHKDPDLVNRAAAALSRKLVHVFGKRVLGPEYPPVAKIMNYYLKHILIKIEVEASAATAKARLSDIIREFYAEKEFQAVRVLTDVDPQ
jgi:primosomal protein N' (replication factor Y)